MWKDNITSNFRWIFSISIATNQFEIGFLPLHLCGINIFFCLAYTIKQKDWIAELLYLESVSDEDIYIYINSPGGSITAGLALYDTMKFIKPKVITICVGLAASMAAFILSAGEKRYALENSEVMIHEPSTNFGGNASDIFNHTKWLERIKNKVDLILAENTKHTINEIITATLRDNFMDSKTALEFGIIDEILTCKK